MKKAFVLFFIVLFHSTLFGKTPCKISFATIECYTTFNSKVQYLSFPTDTMIFDHASTLQSYTIYPTNKNQRNWKIKLEPILCISISDTFIDLLVSFFHNGAIHAQSNGTFDGISTKIFNWRGYKSCEKLSPKWDFKAVSLPKFDLKLQVNIVEDAKNKNKENLFFRSSNHTFSYSTPVFLLIESKDSSIYAKITQENLIFPEIKKYTSHFEVKFFKSSNDSSELENFNFIISSNFRNISSQKFYHRLKNNPTILSVYLKSRVKGLI